MKAKIVISDFDGVVGDSLSIALCIIQEIVNLFDKSQSVNSFKDYSRLLGKNTVLGGITSKQSESLRELYRLLMQYKGSEIKPFYNVLHVYSQLKLKPLILSSSYSATIKKALGGYAKIFDAVFGFDSGKKENVLVGLKNKMDFIYITDSVLDIVRCRKIGVPVIAVSWGYDTVEMLQHADPDYFVANFTELKKVLKDLNLIQK